MDGNGAPDQLIPSQTNTPLQPGERESSTRVFISYAHEDGQLHEKLVKHLSPLKRSGKITIWHDQEILPGKKWDKEIRDHLNTADIILFLVSPDFLDSNYCWEEEVKAALARENAGEAKVLPVLLRPAAWQDTQLSQFQLLPTGTKPVTQWDDQDAAFDDVVQGIRRVVEDVLQGDVNGKGKMRALWNKFISSAAPNVKKLVTGYQGLLLLGSVLLIGYLLSIVLGFFGFALPIWIRYLAPFLVIPFVILLIVEAKTPPTTTKTRGRRALLLSLSAGVISLFASDSFIQSARQLTQLRMGFLPAAGDKATGQADNTLFESDLRDQLGGITVSSNYRESYKDTVDALVQGNMEMAWLGADSYLYALTKCQPRVLLSELTEDGSIDYYSYIIAKKTSGIRSLQDLKGQRFAIVDEISTSGYFVPKYTFKKVGINFDGGDLTLIPAGSHPLVLQAVLSGMIPAGAISSTLYDEAKTRGDFKEGDLIILNVSDYQNYPIPSGPIVLRQDIQIYDALRIEDAFLHIAVYDPPALNSLRTRGFVKIAYKKYQVVLNIAQELGLDLSRIP